VVPAVGGDALAVLRRRLRTQGLTGPGFGSPGEVVRSLVAVQAQEFPETTWSLGERCRPSSAGVVSAGLVTQAFDRGGFLRTHVLRPTWHVVAAEDLPWLLRLSAPRVHAVNGTMYRSTGVGPAERESAARLISTAVGDGPQTRRELAARLAAGGLPAAGFAPAYLIMAAELEGLICSGPMRGRQHTYVLLADRVDDLEAGPRDAAALEELVVRYFSGHGPATVRDFAAWSGMTLTDTRAAIDAAGGRLERRDGPDGTPWYAGGDGFEAVSSAPGAESEAGAGELLLLGMYDETTIAYRDLRVVLADERGGARLERPVVRGGVTIGSWRRRTAGQSVTIEVVPFRRFDAGDREALQVAAGRFGAFFGLRTGVDVAAVPF
jgi:hypothetical protein